MTKRVYHPTLSAWQDVADDAVDSWAEAGWRKSRPKHADDSGAPAVGDFHVASVPVVPAVEPEAPKVEKA